METNDSPEEELKFARYQTQTERSLYRVLNELTRLQFLRRRKEALTAQLTNATEAEAASTASAASTNRFSD